MLFIQFDDDQTISVENEYRNLNFLSLLDILQQKKEESVFDFILASVNLTINPLLIKQNSTG